MNDDESSREVSRILRRLNRPNTRIADASKSANSSPASLPASQAEASPVPLSKLKGSSAPTNLDNILKNDLVTQRNSTPSTTNNTTTNTTTSNTSSTPTIQTTNVEQNRTVITPPIILTSEPNEPSQTTAPAPSTTDGERPPLVRSKSESDTGSQALKEQNNEPVKTQNSNNNNSNSKSTSVSPNPNKLSVTPACTTTTSLPTTPVAQKLTFTTKEEWKLDPKELFFTNKLGSGASATVYKGVYRGGLEVAIKILKAKITDAHVEPKTVKEFQHECELMSTIHSGHILNFYGACLEPRVCIVVEYCSKGSLYHLLKEDNTHFEVTWDRVFQWCTEMFLGLQFLHAQNPPVYHRDLKTLNLLLDNKYSVKMCDFGLARLGVDNSTTLGKMRGTFAYCPPELYYSRAYTKASDVYSSAVVMWELLLRCCLGRYMRPYEDYPMITIGFTIIMRAAKTNLRPTIPEEIKQSCAAGFVQLITESWDADEEKRPSCVQILERIEKLKQTYLAEKQSWEALRSSMIQKELDKNGPKLHESREKKQRKRLTREESVKALLSEDDREDLLGFRVYSSKNN